MKRIASLLFLLIVFQSCSSGSGDSDYEEDYVTEDGYEDGTYCADVSYYNPNTGTSNSYTLEVEVQSNQVTQINWGNGGWMDEDHFYAQDLDDNGYCSFSSDKGYDYTVQIIGQDCGGTDETSIEIDMQEDEEAVSCPKCGGDKDEYDTYCQGCTSRIEDEEENTCSRCGGFQYYVYGGLCDNCTSQDEEDGY